jgi:hypothetical protein
MLRFCSLLFMALATSACQRAPIAVPTLLVTVEMDPQATAAVSSVHDGVIVSVVLDGDGSASDLHHAPHPRVFLGMAEVAVGADGVARFSGLTIPAADYQRLDDPDYTVAVSVFSARHLGPQNLLSCEHAEGRLSAVVRTGLHVRCALPVVFRTARASAVGRLPSIYARIG